MANPKFEKPVFVGPNKNKGFQFGYASGIYYRWQRYLSPGNRVLWRAREYRRQYAAKGAGTLYISCHLGRLPRGIEYNVGPGIGLTRGSDQVIMKFNLELERFVGAIFGPSSETGWFF